MKTSQKLKDLFTHKKAMKKFLSNINKELETEEIKPITIYILIGCSITQEQNKILDLYTIPELAKVLFNWSYLNSFNNQFPIYREHEKLLRFGLIERVTKRELFKGQKYSVSIFGKLKLRSLYNYIIRESFPPTGF